MQQIVVTRNIFLFPLLLLVGCAAGSSSGSSIVVGEVREAINPSQVMQFLEIPENFQLIGIVTAPSDAGSVEQTVGILKNQAAKLGANGIVVVSTTGQDPTVVNGGDTGYIYTVTVPAKSVFGKAIYVE
jgi:hypothetical protein